MLQEIIIKSDDPFFLFEVKVFKPLRNWTEISSMRLSKEEYYLGIAKAVALKSPCLRREYYAIIVKNISSP